MAQPGNHDDCSGDNEDHLDNNEIQTENNQDHSDDNEDQSEDNGNNAVSADPNQSGNIPLGDGPRNGRYPVPATDHFAGELPQNMNISSLATQAVLASAGERVTSLSGTQTLDMISIATVMRQQSGLTVTPQRELLSECASSEDRSSHNIVSRSEASVEQRQIPTSDDPLLSVVPSLSLDSLNACEPAVASSLVSGVLPGSSTSVESPKVKDSKFSKMTVQHFGERREDPVGQVDTSGYRSGDTVSDNACLQLNEAGINANKCVSGTQCDPCYPRYARFPIRLQSYPESFTLGDGVSINRDLLALAGFFYSEHGTVTCFHCGCSPRVWGDGRDPVIEHRMLSPYCRALPSVPN